MQTISYFSTNGLIIDDNYNAIINDYSLITGVTRDELLGQLPISGRWALPGILFLQQIDGKAHFTRKKTFEDDSEAFNVSQIDIEKITNVVGSLWFVKDNACNITECAILSDTDFAYKSSPSTFYSNSYGGFDDAHFSGQEIKKAMYYLDLLNGIGIEEQTPKYELISTIIAGPANHKIYNKVNIVDRAYSFLIYARSSPHLPTKIAFKTLAIECLFACGESSEIQHKIAERLAIYLGKTYEDRRLIYNEFKEYYKIRSGFFHGSNIGKTYNDIANIKNISIKLDNLLRKVFIKILESDSEVFLSDKLIEYFNELLFQKIS